MQQLPCGIELAGRQRLGRRLRVGRVQRRIDFRCIVGDGGMHRELRLPALGRSAFWRPH